MSRRIIEGSYARLLGLRNSAPIGQPYVSRDFGEDYLLILRSLREHVDDEFTGFDFSIGCYFNKDANGSTYSRDSFLSKVNQLITYLEMVHRASSRIVEVGSVYNLISDQELKSRCSDLLSATDHFDRVINQATQVLEERIRLKVPALATEIGTGLVNKAIKSDPTLSPIKFSNSASEQEGYAAILRGLVGAFRNPSHHRFLTEVSREQALQICAFIDNMLSALDQAEISNP
ncbi:TIGR02391 family protein [Martelella mediterranea]|uniref:TIGR02391 family protein n=1 Tax=Martelella mediterranea TaxID=293089 RepID=UPI001E4CDC11|nr:TIGR02391 family protein [Martelella mediterranea]MCD1633723.1 TIGR02391 family protein [Martelella mediterranea]